MVETETKDLLMQNDEGGNLGILSLHRVLRSISTAFITQGMEMDYLTEKVVTRIVAETYFSEELPTTLNLCRKKLNTRGVASLLLEKNGSYEARIDEERIRDYAFDLVSK